MRILPRSGFVQLVSQADCAGRVPCFLILYRGAAAYHGVRFVPMTIMAELINGLIERELSSVSDARVRDHILKCLIEPKPIVRDWDYGAEGEAYTCWTVLEEDNSNVAIAYCEKGFGPGSPWGLVAKSGSRMSIGMDAAWYEKFMHAYLECAASSIAIWRVFRLGSEAQRERLSGDLEWDAAWSEVAKLRATYPDEKFAVDQEAHMVGEI